MKKLLLTLSLCLTALVAMAQNVYNEDINVTLKQEADGQLTEAPLPTAPGSITVTRNGDGTCDFLLPNFSLSLGEGAGSIDVGNINLKGVKMTEGADGQIAIETNQTINIENGDAIDGVTWLGPLLGPVPIDLKGSMNDKHMKAVINIDLTKDMNMSVNVIIGPKPQIYNEDINVTLKQEADGQLTEAPLPTAPGSITVTRNIDGTCDFLLPNFSLSLGEGAGSIDVGNINLKGVKMTEGADGQIAIETNQTINIENGDAIDGVTWLGPLLGPVPIDLKGSINDKHMKAVINIDLTKDMNMSVNVIIGPKPQIYNENIDVTLKQEADGQLTEAPLPTAPGSIEVTKNGDGTCDFLLPNFSLSMGEGAGSIDVGNINLKGVKMTEGTDGQIAIETNQTINIENGDAIDGVTWLGPLLGPVPIVLKGSMDDTCIKAVIDIDLTKDMNMTVNVVISPKSETGITGVTVAGAKHSGVYNLNGVRVAEELNNSLPAGIYIVNGKKVVIK